MAVLSDDQAIITNESCCLEHGHWFLDLVGRRAAVSISVDWGGWEWDSDGTTEWPSVFIDPVIVIILSNCLLCASASPCSRTLNHTCQIVNVRSLRRSINSQLTLHNKLMHIDISLYYRYNSQVTAWQYVGKKVAPARSKREANRTARQSAYRQVRE